jgi:hypothetical protein
MMSRPRTAGLLCSRTLPYKMDSLHLATGDIDVVEPLERHRAYLFCRALIEGTRVRVPLTEAVVNVTDHTRLDK